VIGSGSPDEYVPRVVTLPVSVEAQLGFGAPASNLMVNEYLESRKCKSRRSYQIYSLQRLRMRQQDAAKCSETTAEAGIQLSAYIQLTISIPRRRLFNFRMVLYVHCQLAVAAYLKVSLAIQTASGAQSETLRVLTRPHGNTYVPL
jgi:hypothetical protein